MKRSRIILGMATLVVAAFGAFAFTSKSEASMVQTFYKPTPTTCDDAEQEDPPCVEGGINCLGEASSPAAGQQLYSDPNCQNSLRPESGF